jgi:serine/threonine protein kinase
MTPERWRQIEELYHSARERGREVLADAEPDLRAKVEDLLAQGSGGKLLDQPASQLFIPGPGTEIGPYRLEMRIGSGGMGAVYRARDSRLNRPVAMKFLSERLADPSARRRFQREAQMASALNHPHILTVHDAGEFEDRQYIVTEFIDGGTLSAWAKEQKHSWNQVVDLLAGVADGFGGSA